ncbi:hypothetical protein HOLleu_12022 [Holothuria leucospilota]|uniref:Uncharacterized protein n=1 Tax=Holothuria leucospilota TaxID=206669 RepID=A0A9Q1CAA0_HOLLE|nr:hypothetical protein HOLleu_12022 [Holothuria leucospilota]
MVLVHIQGFSLDEVQTFVRVLIYIFECSSTVFSKLHWCLMFNTNYPGAPDNDQLQPFSIHNTMRACYQ